MTNHTVNKDLSQKLADAGVDVESEFYWFVNPNNDAVGLTDNPESKSDANGDWDTFPAYLLSELLEIMPPRFMELGKLKYGAWLSIDVVSEDGNLDGFKATYADEGIPAVDCFDKNPANAAASLLLWLIEEGHIYPNNLES